MLGGPYRGRVLRRRTAVASFRRRSSSATNRP